MSFSPPLWLWWWWWWSSLCLHINTGTWEWWSTWSLTLPSNVLRICPMPRVPVITRLTFSSSAARISSTLGLPWTCFILPWSCNSREENKQTSTWNVGIHRISEQRKAQTSPRIRAVSPEPSLLVYTKYGCRRRLRQKFRPLATLVTSAWACQPIRLVPK